MDKVTLKCLRDEVKLAVVIIPVLKIQMWWPIMCQMSEKFIEFPVGTEFVEYYNKKTKEMCPAGPLRWPLRANLVKIEQYKWNIWRDEDWKEEP